MSIIKIPIKCLLISFPWGIVPHFQHNKLVVKWWWIALVVWYGWTMKGVYLNFQSEPLSDNLIIENLLRATIRFEQAQNLSSRFDKYSCVVAITTTPRHHNNTSSEVRMVQIVKMTRTYSIFGQIKHNAHVHFFVFTLNRNSA